MATALAPHLGFRGTAREAMAFYQGIFGGRLTVATFAEFHASTDPAEDDLVMHAELFGANGIHLMAADAPARVELPTGSAITLSLAGEDEAELRAAFERLAEGGTVAMPLAPSAWGAVFGMCTDRFGVGWMVNIAAPGAAGA